MSTGHQPRAPGTGHPKPRGHQATSARNQATSTANQVMSTASQATSTGTTKP
jgi:hypothetical protein